MTKAEIIASLLDQAQDKDSLDNGATGSGRAAGKVRRSQLWALGKAPLLLAHRNRMRCMLWMQKAVSREIRLLPALRGEDGRRENKMKILTEKKLKELIEKTMYEAGEKREMNRSKDCSCLVRVSPTDGSYYKCTVYGVSSSTATDWAGKWLACGRFGKPLEQGERTVLWVTKGSKDKPGEEQISGQIRMEV